MSRENRIRLRRSASFCRTSIAFKKSLTRVCQPFSVPIKKPRTCCLLSVQRGSLNALWPDFFPPPRLLSETCRLNGNGILLWYRHATDQNGDAWELHPLCNQSFSFWESLRNFLDWTIEEYAFQFETLRKVWFQIYLIIRERERRTFHRLSVAACFGEPVARRSKILVPRFREAGDNLLRGLARDLHARMDDVTLGVHPGAFFTCSSKLTHCASTTPSEWSIQPTLCAG